MLPTRLWRSTHGPGDSDGAVWLKHAAIAQEHIEDARRAAGERDDGDVHARAGRDAQAQVLSASASGGRRRRMETAARMSSQRAPLD
ncbi:MAG: hypothetical protein DMD86_18765 [Candidatus Rokuibacteriota bacterium]|nr:MAG: hypothetical protein DMD86_18765 [Candidatus Rokubacteria bacterium]